MKKTISTLILACSMLVGLSQTTQINSAYCGQTATSTTQFIWADSLGAPSVANNDRYIFKLVNGATTFTWQTNNEWPIMQWYLITGFAYSTTYTASVAWSNDYGVTFGAFGSTCNITSPSLPTTSLQPTYCGFTASSYSQLIYAETSTGDSCRFKLENASLSYTNIVRKSNYNFILSQSAGLQNGTTYSVSCAVRSGGQWGLYGTVCNVTTPPAPTTSMQSTSCNVTASSYTSQLFRAELITGATEYTFKMENASLSYSQEYVKFNNNFILSQFTGLQNSTTYTISAKVKVNGTYGAYAQTCTITTPATFMRIIKDIYGNILYDGMAKDQTIMIPDGFYIINENGVFRKIIKQ